jgi:hypothetical protein
MIMNVIGNDKTDNQFEGNIQHDLHKALVIVKISTLVLDMLCYQNVDFYEEGMSES